MRLIFLLSLSLLVTCKVKPTLRVLTYNIRLDTPADGVNQWPNRKEKVAALLRAEAPDIFGVQEALRNQMADLEVLVPEYGWYGAGRDDGKAAGEYSAVFFKKEKFDRVDSGTFWLSETLEVPGSKGWDAAITRVCSWVKLAEKNSGGQFFVFNTHFDHVGQSARLHSMELIARKTREIAGTAPFVLMGDFNFEPDAPPYEVVKNKALWDVTDAWAADPQNHQAQPCTFTGFKVAGAECRRIDYILPSRFFKVKRSKIIPTHDGTHYPSDHLPVVADLTF